MSWKMLLAVLVVAGCGRSSGALDRLPADVIPVVATTPQIADLVRNVGGGDVRVHQVIAAGVDPHEVEPTPADEEAIRRSRVIFENGLGLEDWAAAAIEAAGSKAPVVVLSDGLALRRPSPDGEIDPHVWHDPRNVVAMVGRVEEALAAAAPDRASAIRERAGSYRRQVEALDAEVAALVSTVPPDQRLLVTNHDALGYFAERYGFTVVGAVIPSFDSQAELSSRGVRELVARIRRTRVKAVFAESSLPPKTARAVSERAGVRVVAGDDSLYGDSLGPPGSDGDTYIGMVRHNARVIVDNLR